MVSHKWCIFPLFILISYRISVDCHVNAALYNHTERHIASHPLHFFQFRCEPPRTTAAQYNTKKFVRCIDFIWPTALPLFVLYDKESRSHRSNGFHIDWGLWWHLAMRRASFLTDFKVTLLSLVWLFAVSRVAITRNYFQNDYHLYSNIARHSQHTVSSVKPLLYSRTVELNKSIFFF